MRSVFPRRKPGDGVQYRHRPGVGQLFRDGTTGRTRKRRRNSHGSAWHWKQIDCWYYTLPGTKRRVPLFEENGERIRGRENRDPAEQALARVAVAVDGANVPDQKLVAETLDAIPIERPEPHSPIPPVRMIPWVNKNSTLMRNVPIKQIDSTASAQNPATPFRSRSRNVFDPSF